MLHAFFLRHRKSALSGLLACLPAAPWAATATTAVDAAAASPGLYASADFHSGALLALLTYHLALGLSLKERPHLLYGLHVLLSGLMLYAFGHRTLHPATPALLALAGWSLVLLCRDFLDLRLPWPRADAMLRAAQWACLGFVPVCLVLPGAWAATGAAAMAVAVPAVLLPVAAHLLRRGVLRARFVAAALLALLAAMAPVTLPVFGMAWDARDAAHATRSGVLLGLMLLAFALAHRQRLARDETERQQRAGATEIDNRLQACTRELEDRKARLEEANQRLLELVEQDALTGLKNRLFLARHLPETWRHAQRWGEPLAALMIDADHFKRVNDEHGHMAGDEALRQIAHVIGQIVQRPGDHAVRYAGETFLVLLPNTHLAGAAHVAENIRRKIEAMRPVRSAHGSAHGSTHEAADASTREPASGSDAPKKPMQLTVSIGVACMHATTDGDPQTLIATADQLLYQAKQHGRNRCALHPQAHGITTARPTFKPSAEPRRPAPASSPTA